MSVTERDADFVFLIKQDSVTGLLLAGIGHIDQQHQTKNFLIVDGSEFHCPSLTSFHTLVLGDRLFEWRQRELPTETRLTETHRNPNERHRICVPGLYR